MKRPEIRCEECGSDGEEGCVENADGRVWHFRNNEAFKDGKPHPIRCYGKFVEMPHEEKMH
jgi:hypothetical protein